MGKKQLLQSYSREYETPGEFIKSGQLNSLSSEKAGEGAIWMQLAGILYSVRDSPQMGGHRSCKGSHRELTGLGTETQASFMNVSGTAVGWYAFNY